MDYKLFNASLENLQPGEKRAFHIHTSRCGHADGIDEETCIQIAIKKGVTKIYFSDHGPHKDDILGWCMPYALKDDYLDMQQYLKKKYEGLVEIWTGFEVEYMPSRLDYHAELLADSRVDFLLLGQHLYERAPLEFAFVSDGSHSKVGGAIDAMCEAITTGLFPVVAHPDRIFQDIKQWDEEFEEMSKKLIKTAVSHGIWLEKNYSSLMTGSAFRPEFWELVPPEAKVLWGLDAHANEIVSEGLEWIAEHGN